MANAKSALEKVNKEFGIKSSTTPKKNDNRKQSTSASSKSSSKTNTSTNNKANSALEKVNKEFGIKGSYGSNYTSAIGLGLGPVSKERVAGLVKSGDVSVKKDGTVAWANEPAKAPTKTTIKSDLSDKERKARIKEIEDELITLNTQIDGIGRAKAYTGAQYTDALLAKLEEAENKKKELSKELKKLERVGTFSASEMKQFEIDDAKAEKAKLPSYNPTARVALSQVEAYKKNAEAHYALDKEIDRLEREKASYKEIETIEELNKNTTKITSKKDFAQGSKYIPSTPKTAKELKAEGYKQDSKGAWYKFSLGGASYYTGEDSDIYTYINDESKRAKIDATYRNYGTTLEDSGYHLLTPEEKGAYNYLYNQDKKNGTKTADEYLRDIAPLLQRRVLQEDATYYKGVAKEHKVGASIYSFVTNLQNAMMFPAKVAATATGSYDYNLWLDTYGNRTEAIRSGVSEDMGDWGKLGYNAVMSIGDMGTAMLVGGGNAKLIQAIMSSSAGSSTISEAKNSGASDGKALILGLGSAAIEWATEKYSVEAILKKPETIRGFILTNAFTEGAEEGASNISNLALDAIVSELTNERNSIEQRVDYLVLYEGKTEEEALNIAFTEKLQSLGEDVLVGSLTGAGMAGGRVAPIAVQRGVEGAKTQRDVLDTYIKDEKSLKELIESGKESGEGTASFKIAEEVEKAKAEGNLTTSLVKKLINATNKQIRFENKADDKTGTLDLATMEVSEGDLFDKLPLRERLQLISEGSNVSTKDIKKATGFGDEGVSLVSSLMDSKGMTLQQAEGAVKTAYTAGFTNVDKKKVRFVTPLQEQAFNAGKIDRINQDIADQANAKKATVYEGTFTENEYTKGFTDAERKMISTVAKHLGMDISVVDKIIANIATGAEANAEHQDGKMRISSTAERTVHALIMHESGHRMKQLAPTEFGVLMDALYERSMRENAKAGIPLTANYDYIKAEHDNAGISLNTTGYMEEFAVRELETIFGSAEEFNRWVAEIESKPQVKSAWQKFVDWISQIIEDIKTAISQRNMSKEERAEAKKAIAELDRIKELYANAYKAARNVVTERNHSKSETKTAEETREAKKAERKAQIGKENSVAKSAKGKKYSLKDGEGIQKSGGQKADEDNNTIDLTNNTDLSARVGNQRGSAKYKIIRDYILETLGEGPVELSDGTVAKVDKSDALHIANKSANRKMAYIARIKTIVERAKLHAIERQVEHKKFDEFRYYHAKVKYGVEEYPVYLNVGRAKNGDGYHIYDITKKIGATVKQINALERVENDLRSETDSPTSPKIITQTPKFVKGEFSATTDEEKIKAIDNVGVQVDIKSKSIAPSFSLKTWNSSQYVQNKEVAIHAIMKATGVSRSDAERYINNINSIAKMIAEDRARLDYDPNIDEFATVIKPNSEYKWTVDMSTLCAKRLLFTGTFDAIQKRLPNTVFDSDDIVNLRSMMMKKGYEVACGICYVESTRRELGPITQEFIGRYKEAQKTGKPITRVNSEGKVVELKKTKEQMETTKDNSTDKFFADKDYTPTLAELNTTDIDIVKRDHPLVYEAYLNFMNARGQAKPKLLETRTEYKGEILKHFKAKTSVDARNKAGGLRVQSFSDFEVAHLIDMMQIVLDMSRVGLMSQAYTKVPAFADVFGNTGMKINLSLIAKDSGLDADGNLIFDDVEGMPSKEAFRLREKYSKNVGTILVGKNNAHIRAALADPRIDFVISFHKSSWKESLYEALGLEGYDDYTDYQNEKPFDKDRKIKNFQPSEYWDYSKSGNENAQTYLKMCAEDGRTPKFSQFAHLDGYWKLLIDFKMYDNDGIGSPQMVVKPDFAMNEANDILNSYEGGHRTFPVAQDVVDDFVEQYNNNSFSLKGGLSNTEIREKIAEYADGGKITTEKYNELIKTYGAIPKGEKSHRDVSVPAKTEKDKKVSQTVRTILEAKATPDELVPTVEKMLEDGIFSYDVYTDKQAIEDARDKLKNEGWIDAYNSWMREVEQGVVSKETTVQGWALYNNAANRAAAATDETVKKEATQTALSILDAMVRHQRSAAQALQATRILKKLSPGTQLYGIQKSVSALQKELKKKYGKKAPDLKIDENLAEQFINAKTPEERAKVEEEIYKDIGRQMPSNWVDKWNAWRYLAMLGNPRTHVRNILGNAFFAPVVIMKDLTATAIESVVHRVSGKKMLRGKSIVWGSKSDRELLKAAWSDYANVADMVSNGGKYSDFAMKNQYIEEGRKIFKSKLFAPVEWVRKASSKALEVEDVWFSKPHYAYALAQYCKANNITAEQIKNGKAIAPAREYAIKEAQKATYKDTNAFSQFVSEIGRTNSKKNVITKAGSAVVEGVLPFRKTPANILVRGVEYSPFGLIKGLSYDLVQVSKGEMTASEAIDNISAGLTGTGLLVLGVYLAAQGLIRGHGEDEEEERKFKEGMGHQAYSLELPSGQSVTLDWLAPEALPFFVGVNIWETTKGSDQEITMSTILSSVTRISEPMLEMSCLQGLNDLIEGVGNASSEDTSGFVAALSSAVTSYLTQGIPTLGGQAERTGEKERMTTYTEKGDFLTGDMQYTLGKASAKIPFWDYNQIPYIDAWGRREASGTALKRGFNNFLNPAYTSKIESSEMEKELLRLYEQTGETKVFPERADKYFTVDGKRKDLTAEEYVRYATLKGEKSYKLVVELVESDAYKSLDDEGKVKAIADAYDYANQKAKEAISNYKPERWVNTANKFDPNAENYIFFRTNVSAKREANGDKISKEEVVDIISDTAQNDSEAWSMYFSMYDSKTAVEAEKHGIDAELFMTAVVDMGSIKADYKPNGKVISGSRRVKIEKYLNSVCSSYKEYLFLLGTEYDSIKDDADYISYFGKE